MRSGRAARCMCSVVRPSTRKVSCRNECATNSGTASPEHASTQWRVYTGHGRIPDVGAQPQTLTSKLAHVRWRVYRFHRDVFFWSSSSVLCTEMQALGRGREARAGRLRWPLMVPWDDGDEGLP
jgi:hypothetical protein